MGMVQQYDLHKTKASYYNMVAHQPPVDLE